MAGHELERLKIRRLRDALRAASIGAAIFVGAAADGGEAAQRGLSWFRQGNVAEAQQIWHQAAVAGDARSALFLGVSYDAGLGVAQDDRQAMAWYMQAAEGGSAAAAFNIGVLYDAGIGRPSDLVQAAHWYSRAAEKGFGRAEYNLAQLYEGGLGVAPDRARVVALYKAAAAHGIVAARARLARYGEAPTAAIRPTADLALDQFLEAQRLFLNRTPADVARATKLFRSAADRGNALAAYNLGYCYEKGLGLPTDLDQALIWYRRAARDAPENELRNLAASGVANLAQQIRQAQLRP